MRILSATLAVLVLASCTTLGQWQEQPATPQLLSKMAGAHSATLTLADGRVERMTTVRDFGDALCGYNACIRKVDIVKVGYAERRVDVGGTLFAIPLVPVIAAGTAIACYPSCGYPERPPQGPAATPEQISRAWLESLVIREGLIVHEGRPNPCVAPSPAAPERPFATDTHAIAWITANRTEVKTACLAALRDELDERDRWTDMKTHRDARMLISTLLSVRERWHHARCQLGENAAPRFDGELVRITPDPQFDLAKGRGDPALLAIIEQTLADPATYQNDADPVVICAPMLPSSQWPDRAAWARKASPFAPVEEQ